MFFYPLVASQGINGAMILKAFLLLCKRVNTLSLVAWWLSRSLDMKQIVAKL